MKPPAITRNILLVSACAVAALLLCSCGKPDIRKSGLAAAADGGVPARADRKAVAQTLRKTVADGEPNPDRDLLVQQALQAELDRDLRVVQAIERSRRQILAQAYMERAALAAQPASAQETGKFYAENPALFAQRRIYRYVNLIVAVPAGQFDALQKAVAQTQSLAGVVRWLGSRNVPFETSASGAAAEQIPANVLIRLSGMRDGQIAAFREADGASVLCLEQSTQAPLSEAQAQDAIARYLLNRKRIELAHAEMTRLRARGKIEDDGIRRVGPATMAQAGAPARHADAGSKLARNNGGVPAPKQAAPP